MILLTEDDSSLCTAGCASVRCDTNLLTGANDILVARGEDGDLYATPFSVQFGKKDIWLPRYTTTFRNLIITLSDSYPIMVPTADCALHF